MNHFRWLASPLAGTATVLTGLGLLAIPLRKLTSQGSATTPVTAAATPAADQRVHAVLRLRLLAPARHLSVSTTTAVVLLDRRDLVAGESEHDVEIPHVAEGLDLTLRADFGDHAAPTAVFLTVMPDGEDDQTRYVIGTGRMEESLHYTWHTR